MTFNPDTNYYALTGDTGLGIALTLDEYTPKNNGQDPTIAALPSRSASPMRWRRKGAALTKSLSRA